MNLLSYSSVGLKFDKGLHGLKSRCGQSSFWRLCGRICFLDLSSFYHSLGPHQHQQGPQVLLPLLLLSGSVQPGKVVSSEGLLWSQWAIHLIQNTLPSSRSLTSITYVKSFCYVRQHIYRFWVLGCGLWRPGAPSRVKVRNWSSVNSLNIRKKLKREKWII